MNPKPWDGMIVDEGVIVEIVTPGTGNPVAVGEVGEVVVTTLNRDYPLVRFATGDLSAVMAGQSPCGRTNMRIKGWMGRAIKQPRSRGCLYALNRLRIWLPNTMKLIAHGSLPFGMAKWTE
jgi:hypothetical protein